MSNQTQTPALNVPQTIHIWLFAAAIASTFFAIPHAVVAFMFDMPLALVNLHIAMTLGLWIGGIVFVARRPTRHDVIIPAQQEDSARPMSPGQQKQLSEIDRLEAWLNLTDEGR